MVAGGYRSDPGDAIEHYVLGKRVELSALRKDGATCHNELAIVSVEPSDSHFWANVLVTAIKDATGRLVGFAVAR